MVRGLALGVWAALSVPGASADVIAAGRDFAGAIDSANTLRTWGTNNDGQLGHDTGVSPVAQPKPVTGSYSAVAMGQDFTLAIDTSNALWAWGNNTLGQLGRGGTTASSVPVRVTLPIGAIVRAVAAGQSFALALVDVGSDHGRVYAWGGNGSGQLGLNTTNSSANSTPVYYSASSRRYTAIATTDFSAVAVATDGSLWAWGDNLQGQLGQGNTFGAAPYSSSVPIRVGTATGWTRVAGGAYHVLALQGGALYAWGNNQYGQLGNGPAASGTFNSILSTPVQIAAGTSWATIGAGDYHSLATTATGDLYAWGLNFSGELDLAVSQTGGSNSFPTPQLIGAELAPWASAVGGADFTIARTVAGGVYLVGGNANGQLGSGETDSSINFSPVFAAAQVSGVSLVANAPVVPATTVGVNTIMQPVTVSVQNTGAVALAGNFVVSLYLSDDSGLDAGDTLLATSTQSGGLGPLASRTISFTAPDVAVPEVPPGARFLISQVVQEGAADPVNPATGAATALSIAGPDLTVESLQVAGSHTAIAGGTFTGVSATLRNGGVGAVPAGRAVLVKVYLSTTTTLNHVTDVLVGQFTYTGGLAASGAAGASVVISPAGGTVAVPASMVGGSYQLLFSINEDNSVTETGSLPDVTALGVGVQSSDLAVSAPSLPNVAAASDGGAKFIGTSATLSGVVVSAQNVGTQAYSGGFTVSLYLSTDSVLSADDRLLASTPLDNTIIPSVSSVAKALPDFAVPAVPPGNYFLIAQINPTSGSSDANPANDTAALPVRVSGPDFTLTDFLVFGKTTTAAGTSFGTVTATLRNLNLGVLPVGQPLLVQTWLSNSPTFSPATSTLLDSYSYTGGLAAGPGPGSFANLPGRLITVPAGTPGGVYSLIYVVNGDNAIAESGATIADPAGTANDFLAVTVTVSSFDLAVSAPIPTTPGATAGIGVNTTLSNVAITVQNRGVQSYSAGATVELYLSTDAILDPGDRLLQTQAITPGTINPLGSVLVNMNGVNAVTIPDFPPGNYFLLSRVVLPTGQTDSSLTNNVAATAITLVGPSLAVAMLPNAAGFPNTTTINAGGSFGNVTYNLVNHGVGAVAAGDSVNIEVFLSSNTTASSNITVDRNADVLLDQYFIVPQVPFGPGATLTLPLTPHPINLPQGVLNGVYNLLFVASGNDTAPTVQPVSVGALDASVTMSPPTNTSLGVNTILPDTAVTVNNLGGFPIPPGTVVQLYLSLDSQVDSGDLLLGTQTLSTQFPGGTTRQITFSGIVIPANFGQGSFHLLALITLPTGLIDTNLANNVADTPVTLQQPELSITATNVANTADLDLPNPGFTGVTFTLKNEGQGNIPAGTPVTLEVYLSNDPTLNTSTDTRLVPVSPATFTYSGGLAGGTSVTIPAFNIPLDPGTVGGNYYLIFVANRDRNVQENDAVVATAAQPVFLQKTNAPGLALDYGAFGFGAGAEWFPVTDSRASGSSAYQSPALGVGQSSTITLNVTGPTTINAPWQIVGNATIVGRTIVGDEVSYAVDGVTPLSLTGGSLVIGETYQIVSYAAGDSFTNVGAPSNTAGVVFTATGTTPNQVSGTLTVRATYQILSHVTGDDFTNVGAASNTNGVVFTATGTTPHKTSGSLIVGASYQILNYAAGDDFANVGAPANATGVVFTANNTTPTTWANGSSLSTWANDSSLATWNNGSSLSAATLTGFQPSYKPKLITVGAGPHTVSWTYTQNSAATNSFARVDLDPPGFITGGDGSWFGVADATAPTGTATVARSPVLVSGQQASLQLAVTGPAVVSFWWRTDSVAGQDTLGFFIDGQLAQMPTTTFFTDPAQAVISGNTTWANVAFLVGDGPHSLSWVYSQNSPPPAAGTPDSAGFVDGLQVLSPIPATNAVNRVTNPADHAAVPPSNIDLAIKSVIAPTGNYLLDDANGTGRLPVTITVDNIGAPFTASQLAAGFNAADLELHLSTNRVFGDGDDIDLGSYAELNTLVRGNEVVFDGQINLPFDIPSGNYYLLVRYGGASNQSTQTSGTLLVGQTYQISNYVAGDDFTNVGGSNTVGATFVATGTTPTAWANGSTLVRAGAQTEFTLANNTQVLGPGYVIQRAPDLRIGDIFQVLSPGYPYHPEDSVFIKYVITNTGLGTVLPTQPFQVQVDLMAVAAGVTDLTTATLVKSFTPVTYSLFLPEVSGQYPNGGSAPVTQFLDLPTLRDLLVAISAIPAGTPEDDELVTANAAKIATYGFFFRVTVDSGNAIAESSETNTFKLVDYQLVNGIPTAQLFSMIPVPSVTSAGAYFGSTIFGSLVSADNAILSGTTFNLAAPAGSANGQFTSLILNYATGQTFGQFVGSPQTLFQPLAQNGFPSLVIPPGGADSYLTQTFDFNVRADDIAIDVQSSPDLSNWTTLVTLSPPYLGVSGPKSLTGFGGLKDNPYVLSVDGNSTDVQQVYIARVTVRDSLPAPASGSRFMRLNIRSTVGAPSTPTVGTPFADATTGLEDIPWTGILPTVPNPFGPGTISAGAFIVERKQGSNPYVVVGVVTDPVSSANPNSFVFGDTVTSSSTPYDYRVRAITSGGSSTITPQTMVSVFIP